MISKYNCIIGNCADFNVDVTNPESVVEIDASEKNNNVPKLDDDIFVKLGILEKLYLADCNIIEVSAKAFQGLKNWLNWTCQKIKFSI